MDVKWYANEYGVDTDLAHWQLEAQGLLDEVPFEEYDVGFAGIAINPGRDFTVDYFTTKGIPGEAVLDLRDRGVLEPVRISSVAASLPDLRRAQRALSEADAVPAHDSYIDVRNNRIVAEVVGPVSASDFEAVVPGNVDVVVNRVDELASPALGGGGAMTTCTAGFTVTRISTGNRGISTAAHCPNNQAYSGDPLTFQAAKQSDNADVQWHDRAGVTWTNTVADGQWDTSTPYYRYISARAFYPSMDPGDTICKMGKVTGYDCGQIVGVNAAPSYVANAENFVVADGSADLVEGGDSGGPVFLGNTALGLISGHPSSDPSRVIIMPLDGMSALGIRVSTG